MKSWTALDVRPRNQFIVIHCEQRISKWFMSCLGVEFMLASMAQLWSRVMHFDSMTFNWLESAFRVLILGSSRNMRWHQPMCRWCIFFHLVSLVSLPAVQHISLMSTDFSHSIYIYNEFPFQISWLPVHTLNLIISKLKRCQRCLEKMWVT